MPASASAVSSRPVSSRPASSRIGPLDTFRCLTVTLALLSHAILEFKVSAVTDPGVWLALRSVTRSATPGLLLLFGVMAEVVHYARYRRQTPAQLRRPYGRLSKRMAQCYATFVGLSALVTAMRPEPVAYFLRSLGLLTLEGYTVIFALYFFLLLALVAVLPLRHRWGFGGLGALLAAVWALDALVVSRLPRPVDALAGIADMTLGTAAVWGPSAFHSLTLLVAGMALGNVLYARTPDGRPARERAAVRLVAALGVAAVALVAEQMHAVGVKGFFEHVVDLSTYRAHNAPVYYAYGVLAAAIAIPVSYALDALAPARLRGVLHRLGGKTFSYFVIGNALLIVTPDTPVRSGWEAVGLVAAFLVASAVLTLGWAAFTERRRAIQGG